MSSSYSNVTVVAAPGDAVGLEQVEDVTNLFDESKSVVLVCQSNNWLPASLAKIAAAYRVSGLEYLGPESTQVTVLDASPMDAAMRAIELVLSRITSDPGSFVRLMEQACTEIEVLEALRSAPQLPMPRHDPDNDWGFEEPLTAIGFLKSHLEVLRIALNSGCHAVHAQS